jgi:hypothetical protein
MRSLNDSMVSWICVACSLLGIGAVNMNCSAKPQDQQTGEAPEKEAGASLRRYPEGCSFPMDHSERKSIGSPYVELDSWVYPALERLGALGFIKNEFLGMRPWTRVECAQLLEEAGGRIRVQLADSSEANRLHDALSKEFPADLDSPKWGTQRSVHMESLYTSATEITGRRLNDSRHFGQIIINNYGRPYQRGLNSVDGFSGWGTAGCFTLYVRGENQHAPSTPGYPSSVRILIAGLDQTPVQSATFVGTTNQFLLLDTYVAANLAGWDLALGKQSLWWDPRKEVLFCLVTTRSQSTCSGPAASHRSRCLGFFTGWGR